MSPKGGGTRSAVVRQALRNSSLRRVLAAFLIFNIAEWANWIALIVWAYDRGGVRWASGIALAQLIPSALLASPTAALSGRVSKSRALALGYLTQALTFLLVGVVLVIGAPVAVIVVCAAVAAVSITQTRPVHNAVLPEISETTGDLTAGNAASGALEALAIFVGPLLSGLVVVTLGPGGVFFMMGTMSLLSVTWVITLTTAAPIRISAVDDVTPGPRPLKEVLRDPAARLLCAMVAAENVLVGMLDILLAVLALDLLAMSDAGPGVLSSAIGLGGVLGATLTFVLIGRDRLAPALLVGALGAGLPLVLAGWSASAAVAVVLVAVCGAGKLFFDVASRTFAQRLLPDRLLTALFGLQETVMMAGLAVGALAAPLLVELISPRGSFLVAGLFLPVVALSSYRLLRRLDANATVPADVFDLLRAVPILAVLAPRIVERMARDAVPVSTAAGDVVIEEGDVGRHFYVIAAGEVRVSRGGQQIRELGPGAWFGELALLRQVPRTATVTALSEVSLWAVERDAFLASVAVAPHSVQVADDHAREHYR